MYDFQVPPLILLNDNDDPHDNDDRMVDWID